MESRRCDSTTVCHLVALPYPGRGHINPMMNICKQLVLKKPEILITFVVTDEWFSFIGSDPKPDNIRFLTLPNVIPSELIRGVDFPAFLEAVYTKLEEPFEKLLDRMEEPVTAIMADTYLPWVIDVGNRRNIPVVSLWTMSATMFSMLFHFDLVVQNRHFPIELSERGEERVDYIPGVSPTRIADLPSIFHGSNQQVLDKALKATSSVPKAQYLLFTSVYELESQAIEALKPKFPFPIHAIGPSIPYKDLELEQELNSTAAAATAAASNSNKNYLQWLDSQPKNSVLYVSFGSFLSVSASQMEEVIAGIRSSGVRYLWVARGDGVRIEESEIGVVVSWCDQLRVLNHPSIGGFWTHCGWNSTLEAVYAGVPMLTFPIIMDQMPDSKQIVEDWKIGWRVKGIGSDDLVKREEICEVVRRFMDLDEDEEVIKMRERGKVIGEICKGAIAEGGSSYNNLDAFIGHILS